ncbi:MAG: hypothetical protein MJ252_01290 [archaeon]|nr:hypothetical protein [archaeon]
MEIDFEIYQKEENENENKTKEINLDDKTRNEFEYLKVFMNSLRGGFTLC